MCRLGTSIVVQVHVNKILAIKETQYNCYKRTGKDVKLNNRNVSTCK